MFESKGFRHPKNDEVYYFQDTDEGYFLWRFVAGQVEEVWEMAPNSGRALRGLVLGFEDKELGLIHNPSKFNDYAKYENSHGEDIEIQVTNIRHIIMKLREFFRDDETPRIIIKTVKHKGYKWVLDESHLIDEATEREILRSLANRTEKQKESGGTRHRLEKQSQSEDSASGTADQMQSADFGNKPEGKVQTEDSGPRSEEQTPSELSSRVTITWSRGVVAVLILATVTALSFIYFSDSKDLQPSQLYVENSILVVAGVDGEVLWRKPLGKLDSSHLDVQANDRSSYIGDIDGDGRKEVVFSRNPLGVKDSISGEIICYSDRGREKWRFRFGFQKDYPGDPLSPHYEVRFLTIYVHDGKPYILASASNRRYPGQIVLIDPEDGRLIREYWHLGHIQAYAIHDFDGDGQDELVLGGANNANHGHGHAWLGIFSWELFHDVQQEGYSRERSGLWGGSEDIYYLFPNADIVGEKAVMTKIISVGEDGVIKAEISLVIHERRHHTITYHMRYNGDVISCGFNDWAWGYHDQLFQKGILDHRFDPAELEQLEYVIAFPTMVDANNDPEVKRRFEEMAAERRPRE